MDDDFEGEADARGGVLLNYTGIWEERGVSFASAQACLCFGFCLSSLLCVEEYEEDGAEGR